MVDCPGDSAHGNARDPGARVCTDRRALWTEGTVKVVDDTRRDTPTARAADARALSDVAVLSLTMDDIMNSLGGDVSCQILVNIIIALSHRLRRANVQ